METFKGKSTRGVSFGKYNQWSVRVEFNPKRWWPIWCKDWYDGPWYRLAIGPLIIGYH